MSLQSGNPKLDKLIMTNGLAFASTTVPIFVPKSNELKAPIVFNREIWSRMEGNKKENSMDKDLGRRTSLEVYGNVEDCGDIKKVFINDSLDTSFSQNPRKLHTEKKWGKIGIFGVN